MFTFHFLLKNPVITLKLHPSHVVVYGYLSAAAQLLRTKRSLLDIKRTALWRGSMSGALCVLKQQRSTSFCTKTWTHRETHGKQSCNNQTVRPWSPNTMHAFAFNKSGVCGMMMAPLKLHNDCMKWWKVLCILNNKNVTRFHQTYSLKLKKSSKNLDKIMLLSFCLFQQILQIQLILTS